MCFWAHSAESVSVWTYQMSDPGSHTWVLNKRGISQWIQDSWKMWSHCELSTKSAYFEQLKHLHGCTGMVTGLPPKSKSEVGEFFTLGVHACVLVCANMYMHTHECILMVCARNRLALAEVHTQKKKPASYQEFHMFFFARAERTWAINSRTHVLAKHFRAQEDSQAQCHTVEQKRTNAAEEKTIMSKAVHYSGAQP